MRVNSFYSKLALIREFQARVSAIMRRVALLTQEQVQSSEQLHFGQLQVDVSKREVSLAGQQVELTSTEFDLLLYMARRPGHVFDRNQLLNDVWGYHHSGYEHTVNSHINRLRNKLETNPSKPSYVLTVWGVGYKFNNDYAR